MRGSSTESRGWPNLDPVAVERTHHVNNSISARLGFVFTVLYLVFEYARPQDQISQLGAIRPGLILIAILVVLLAINWQRLRMVASRQTSHMLLLLCLLALHVPFAFNNGRAYLATESFLIIMVLFASIVAFVDSFDRLRTLMKWWIFLAVYNAVKGILGGGVAGSSFLQDENDFALLMNMMLPFGIFMGFYEQRKLVKSIWLAASILCVASVIVSFSRGGFVGLIAVAFVIWLTSSRKLLLLGAAAGIALVVMNLQITHTGTQITGSTYWEEMATIGPESGVDHNRQSRFELWNAAWEMFKDHPLGVGPQNFPVRLPEYQTEYFGDKSMWGKGAHSIWFTLLPELGIPGFLLYLSLLFTNVRDIRYLKNQRAERSDIHRFTYFLSLAYIASLAGFLASGTFLSVLYYPHYWYLTAMIVATKKIYDGTVSSQIGTNDGQVRSHLARGG